MRTLLGVVAGYVVFAVFGVAIFLFSGIDPHRTPSLPVAAATTIAGAIAAFGGGFLAAKIARNLRSAQFVAAIIAALAVVGMIVSGGRESIWSNIVTILIMAPMALAGGGAAHR